MVNSVKKEEEDALNYKFKANKIPITTKIPLFENLTSKEEEKRKRIKEESIKLTLQN